MTEIILNDRAKVKVLNAVMKAECDLIDQIRINAVNAKNYLLEPEDINKEKSLRDTYAALYGLCCDLNLDEFYNEWREESAEYEEE